MAVKTIEDVIGANKAFALLSQSKFTAKLREAGFTKDQIDSHFRPQELTQIYAKPKSFPTYKITGPPYSFQVDVMFLPKYAKSNRGITSALLLVDILSRKAYCYPLKSGKMDDILDAYSAFLSDVGEPLTFIEGDDQFSATAFRDFNEKIGVPVISTVSAENHITRTGNPLGIVDRLTKTLKLYIQKYMLVHKSTKWTEWLQSIVDLYNDTEHSGIKNMTPDSVFDDEDYADKLFDAQTKANQTIKQTIKLKPGDRVRAMVGKGIFDKEKANFSTEIYTIDPSSYGLLYTLRSEAGTLLKRRYRAGELLVVTGAVKNRVGDGQALKAKKEAEHKKATKVAKERKQIDSNVPAVALKRTRKATKFFDDN